MRRHKTMFPLAALLTCATASVAYAQTASTILTCPAGNACTRTLLLPWSSRSSAHLPHVRETQIPTGLTARVIGWTSHHHALRILVAIPARLSPGLYTGKLNLVRGQRHEPVTFQVAVEALYIGLQGGGRHQGIVVESTDGKILQHLSEQITAGIPEQGRLGVSGMAYNPQNGTLYINAGGPTYATNVVTPGGQFMPSPIPRSVISEAVPTFIAWAGGDRFLWARQKMYLLNMQGQTVATIHFRLDQDGAPLSNGYKLIPDAGTTDPTSGDIYLSNGTNQKHHVAWIYRFNAQGHYIGHIRGPYSVMALTFDPDNQELYVLGHENNPDGTTYIEAFTPQGQAVPLPRGAFPGTRLLSTPIAQTVLSANPVNGNLYYLSRKYILVYTPNGRVLRKLPSPEGANNITFVPEFLTPATPSMETTAAPIASTTDANPAQVPAPLPAMTPQCPPGYRCIPNTAPQPSPPPSAAPSLNHALNQAANTANTIDDLSNAVSNVVNALH